jgi:glycine/D-amino acid oxidase-like deaminating enzyme
MATTPPMNRDFEQRPYWWATMPELPARSGRQLPDTIDVAVVGGGYTGIAAARKFALQGAKVVVLEAETLGYGASTRNGGIIHPGYKWGFRSLQKKYGDALARELYFDTIHAWDFLTGLIKDNNVDCEFRDTGQLELAWAPVHAEAYPAEVEELKEVGRIGTFVPRERIRDEIGSDAYHGGLAVEGAGILHPAKWFVGLVGLAERAGAELHEGVRASKIRKQADGRFVVETDRGAILAKDVLVATNGYVDGVVPALRRRIVPLGSYIIATEQLPADLAHELSPTRRAMWDSRNFLSYWHVSADNRMIFGGRVSFFPTTIARTARLLWDRLMTIHPQLAPYRVEYAWGGKVAMAFDRMPHVGRTGGVAYAMGYAGTGVLLSSWMGTRTAEWMGGGAAPPQSKYRFPLVPAPFEGRPWFMPIVGEYFRFRDRLDARKGQPEA